MRRPPLELVPDATVDVVDAEEYMDSVSLRVEPPEVVRLRPLHSSVSLRVSREPVVERMRPLAPGSLRVEEPDARLRSTRSRPDVARSCTWRFKGWFVLDGGGRTM
jgi:hypothetical protein